MAETPSVGRVRLRSVVRFATDRVRAAELCDGVAVIVCDRDDDHMRQVRYHEGDEGRIDGTECEKCLRELLRGAR